MITASGYTIGGPGEAADIKLHPRPSRFAPDGAMRPEVPYGYGDTPDTQAFLQVIAGLTLKKKRVADVGAGTGILALAAAKAGAVVVAFESDPVARELLERNVALNGAAIEVRGAFPEAWDGRPFDVAFANLGAAVPPAALAPALYVTSPDDRGVVILPGADHGRRPAILTDADRQALRAANRRVYPRTLAHAKAALRGTDDPFAEPEHVKDWEAIVERHGVAAAVILAEFPEDQDGVAMLVARGNEAKLKRHAYHREVGASTGTPWWDITVNLITLSCGCEHEHWRRDGHADGTADEPPMMRHHRARRQCANHPGDGRAAWQRAHEQYELLGDMQRLAPGTHGALVNGRLVLDVPEEHKAKAGAAAALVHGAPDWLEVR